MGVIYQLTFFTALALLAIVITIFVLAVSLLGRAIEAAARMEREKIQQRKDDTTKEIALIKEQIEKAEKTGQIPKGLTQDLLALEQADKKLEKELARIRRGPESLTARGGVFYPCSSLLGALVLVATAWYLSNVQNLNWIIPLVLWILALGAVAYSMYRICNSLGVIQNVAVTSEEAWMMKMIEAFKRVQKELEDERITAIELKFEEAVFPLEIQAGSEFTLDPVLAITRGIYAEDIELHLGFPKGFEFLDKTDTYELASHYEGRDYVFRSFTVERFARPLNFYLSPFQIRAYPTVGRFKMIYYIAGKNLSPVASDLEVIVT